MPHQVMSPQATETMQRCIQDCLDCYRSCLDTIRHCLELGGKHADAQHITLLEDCAQICEATAASMLRQSDLNRRLAAVCAEACERCAESCERIGPDDEVMRACAETCRRCARSCREMAA
jgi:hypothetical protein